MLRIALDFDNTLVKTIPAWINRYNQLYPDNPKTIQDVTEWNFYKNWGLSRKDATPIFHYVWSNWTRLDPQDMNQSATLKGLKFDVVTSIEPFYTQFVTKWCLLHNINYSNLIQKKDHKEELDYDIFIDDNPNLAKDIKDNQILLLYRQEWNKNTPESKNVILVDSLDDSTRYIYIAMEQKSKKK